MLRLRKVARFGSGEALLDRCRSGVLDRRRGGVYRSGSGAESVKLVEMGCETAILWASCERILMAWPRFDQVTSTSPLGLSSLFLDSPDSKTLMRSRCKTMMRSFKPFRAISKRSEQTPWSISSATSLILRVEVLVLHPNLRLAALDFVDERRGARVLQSQTSLEAVADDDTAAMLEKRDEASRDADDEPCNLETAHDCDRVLLMEYTSTWRGMNRGPT
ncbi:hypothetical protein LIA77_01416 [Sarocladium implicatum]|nr:hypothetical protein LIA77_01416 [Sarocladium implicatum]